MHSPFYLFLKSLIAFKSMILLVKKSFKTFFVELLLLTVDSIRYFFVFCYIFSLSIFLQNYYNAFPQISSRNKQLQSYPFGYFSHIYRFFKLKTGNNIIFKHIFIKASYSSKHLSACIS